MNSAAFNDYTEDEIERLRDFFPQGVVFFDLETTGLSPLTDEIIEIAAMAVDFQDTCHFKGRTRGVVEIFDELVRPPIAIPPYTTKIHQITDSDVARARTINYVIRDFMKFIRQRPLVAHNAKFDVGFLLKDLSKFDLPFPMVTVYDSCKLARKAFPQFQKFSLSHLVSQLQLSSKNAHRALADTINAAYITLKGLNAFGGKVSLEKIESLMKLYSINTRMENYSYILPEKFKSLLPFLEKQDLIDINYQSGSQKGQFRPIRPIGFLVLPHGVALYAQCVNSNHNKGFILEKIADFRKSLMTLPAPLLTSTAEITELDNEAGDE